MSPTRHDADEKAGQAEEIIALENRYLLQTYARYPVVLKKGVGCRVYDLNGNEYLDLLSGVGVNALGYAHPRIVGVIREQAGLLLHSCNLFSHEYQGPLTERLAKITGLDRTFFCNSGAEAVEGAIKMIRAHGNRLNPEKYEIVSLENSFHGRTMGALAITGQEKYRRDFEPMIPGVRFAPQNDISALERAVGPKTAGIVLEVIQGEGGVLESSFEYVAKARELANRFNALLVFDETQCGVGRPGTYFGYQIWDRPVLPDVMVAAKPLACGIPMGIVVANEEAASSIGRGMHGSTFGGGPLVCRVALEFLDILDELLPSIQRTGAYFQSELRRLSREHSFIRDVRGKGLMIGVELDMAGEPIVRAALADGLLINCTHGNVLRFLPPYIITDREVDIAISKLSRIFRTY